MNTPLKDKKILIVTPSFPIPEIGAEQADRAEGIRQFKRLGAEVVVIAKVTSHADQDFIQKTAKEFGIRVVMVPYRYSGLPLSLREKIVKHLGKLRHPLYLDGAAYEYAEPGIQKALESELESFAPDVVWFEYTYLWPLYSIVRRKKIPIVTRSINFEPEHFLEEDGYTLVNYLKFIPKFFGEWLTVRWSDAMLAITPSEERVYRKLGAKKVLTLPLRSLARFTTLPSPLIRDTLPLHVFFMGSSYTVAHNKAALELIVKDIAPSVEHEKPNEFVFHILGKKVPKEFESYCDGVRVIAEGPKYGTELEEFLSRMDIALVPSLMGAGQQQKVFEPITRGFPTITSERAIAGYAFVPGEHFIAAHTAKEFVDSLIRIRAVVARRQLAERARMQARKVFEGAVLDQVITQSVDIE